MVQSLESRIHKLLLEHGDSLRVADLLLKDWETGNLAWVEQEAVGHFLIRCGFVRACLDQILKILRTGQKVPWSSFAEALSLCKNQLSREDFDQIFVGASEEQSLSDLVKCTALDGRDPRFEKIRADVDNTVLRAEKTPPPIAAKPIQEHKENTMPVPSAAPVIAPLTPRVAEDLAPEETSSLVHRIRSRTSNENVGPVLQVFNEALQKAPGQEKEAAIALAMMGAWSEGLQLLRRMPDSLSRNFLELEFLLHGNKCVEVLDLGNQILQQVVHPKLTTSQKSFVQFQMAQALLELKRPTEAHQVLKALLNENPDHHSARSLLSQLKAGVK